MLAYLCWTSLFANPVGLLRDYQWDLAVNSPVSEKMQQTIKKYSERNPLGLWKAIILVQHSQNHTHFKAWYA